MIKDKLYSTYLDAICDKVAERTVELSGIPPLSFTSKGKPLTAWSITGNTVQNGTPTPENPVEVQAVGDYDSETGLYRILVVTSADGTEPITTPIYLPTPLYSGEVMRSDGSREVKWGVVDLGSMAYGYYNGLFYFTIPEKKESKTNDIISLLICEKYIVTKTHSSMSCNNYEIYEYTGADKKRVVIRNDDYDNTKTFKEAMKGVMLYYELEEPKTETFTAPQIPTINGTTVIDVDTAVKPSSMTIKYKGV